MMCLNFCLIFTHTTDESNKNKCIFFSYLRMILDFIYAKISLFHALLLGHDKNYRASTR
ncbi:hypothetical protein lpari_02972 [Legionella parisiensis]|uniref:Uncharacterized protein n=1 Tax=Legionella parisiensis TaxID=45071 RepID=A0A1E5JNI4_9GAMM|nr:hypothetical protein lpari_02972 [Legionella parisiensis]